MAKRKYNRIKGALSDADVTGKKLAEHLAVDVVTVSRWCTNVQQPTIETLFAIADYLDINVQELLVSNRPNSFVTTRKK